LAFSFPSQIASNYFPEKHDEQLHACFDIFFRRNMDARVVEISRSSLKYKLLIVPGVTVMDTATANNIRRFVADGGTVIMTANSSLVDESGRVFSTNTSRAIERRIWYSCWKL
jgi:beta-galactosidase